jgi:hypothetical protein
MIHRAPKSNLLERTGFGGVHEIAAVGDQQRWETACHHLVALNNKFFNFRSAGRK